jgi:hypothetical protein
MSFDKDMDAHFTVFSASLEAKHGSQREES